MQQILENLNEELGIKGSLIMSPDGVVVASVLDDRIRDEVVAALISMVLLTLNRAIQETGYEPFDNFVMTASYGKLVVVNLETAYLVVISDQFIKLDLTQVEIASAAERIRRRGKLSV